MRTINLQTVYQLVITSLLLGACLGLLGQRLSWLTGGITFDPPVFAASSTVMTGLQSAASSPAAQNQDVTTSKNSDSNVQVEVEVHTRGNANAHARALGPGNTEVKTSTEGEGDGRSAAYLKAPDVPAWTSLAQPSSTLPASTSSATATAQPSAMVTEALVNLRSSSDLGSTIVGNALQGEEFSIIGRDALHTWWLVCCDGSQTRWIHSAVVQVIGDTANVPLVAPSTVAIPSSSQPALLVPTPTILPLLPTVTPPVEYEFMLAEQAQFEERITPRIYLYVYEKEDGLEGYTVRVRKDGHELPVVQQTAPGMPGITWPIPTERQRYTNLKVEFPQITPAGVWEVQLVDADGRAVGPVATFRLQPDEPHQEMYVKYRRR